LTAYESPDIDTDVQNDEDQRENHRREQEMKRIAALPLALQQAAREAEAIRQHHYDNKTYGTLTGQLTSIDAGVAGNRTKLSKTSCQVSSY
jgi:flagellar biosynthesis regulator FlaF